MWSDEQDVAPSRSGGICNHNDPEATLNALHATRADLTEAEARIRIAPPHWLVQLAGCFWVPLILVLVALDAISWTRDPGNPKPVVIVSMTVTISAALRFCQEYRFAQGAERLKTLVRTTATVLRRSSGDSPPIAREVPMREVVPGDIVRVRRARSRRMMWSWSATSTCSARRITRCCAWPG